MTGIPALRRRSLPRCRHPRRSRGQSLVEFAIVAPFVITLLLGGAQVGAIMYANVAVDTVAREGARYAVQNPNGAGLASLTSPHTCTGSSDPVSGACAAAYSALSGLLSASQMSVTITVNDAFSAIPGDVIRVARPTPTPTPTPTPAPTPSGSCPSAVVGENITVRVTYKVSLFVPGIGKLFDNDNGDHLLTSVVTMAVAPCGVTLGN